MVEVPGIPERQGPCPKASWPVHCERVSATTRGLKVR